MSRDPFQHLRESNPMPDDHPIYPPMSTAERIAGGAPRRAWPAWALAGAVALAVLVGGGSWLLWVRGGDPGRRRHQHRAVHHARHRNHRRARLPRERRRRVLLRRGRRHPGRARALPHPGGPPLRGALPLRRGPGLRDAQLPAVRHLPRRGGRPAAPALLHPRGHPTARGRGSRRRRHRGPVGRVRRGRRRHGRRLPPRLRPDRLHPDPLPGDRRGPLPDRRGAPSSTWSDRGRRATRPPAPTSPTSCRRS